MGEQTDLLRREKLNRQLWMDFGTGAGMGGSSGEVEGVRIWWMTAKIKGHLKGSIKTWYSRNFLNIYIYEDALTEMDKWWGRQNPNWPSLVTKWTWWQAWSPRIGLYLIVSLVKGVPWDSPNNPGCCQDYRFALYKMTSRPHCEDTFTIYWTWKNWASAYTEPCFLV